MAGHRRLGRRSARRASARCSAPLLTGRDADDLVARCRETARAVVGQRGGQGRGRRRAARPGRAPARRTAGAAPGRHDAARAHRRHALGRRRRRAGRRRARPGRATGSPCSRSRSAWTPRATWTRVRRVRAAVGPRPLIRLDANQGWTPREAVRVIRGIEDAGLDVELVEQPVPRARPRRAGAGCSDRVSHADPRRRGGVRRARPRRGDPPPGGRHGQRQARQVRRPRPGAHAAGRSPRRTGWARSSAR